MIKRPYRGQGIGPLLVNASLEIAKALGFHAMQFNMVLSQNTAATKLYQKLGFSTLALFPKPSESGRKLSRGIYSAS